MKIGVIPINVGVADPGWLIALSQKAEEIGLESAWTFEHVVVPVDYESKYPYAPEGKMGATPETPFIDPLIAIAFAAGHTKTLRFGTGVNILPQANPLFLAKQAASIDVLSGGRFMLGLGTGWLREEYDALGTPFEKRGKRFDDYITAMKKVWSEDVVEHDGEFVKFTGFKSYPLPVQKPLPIIIGGATKPALRRVAKHGDGWFAPSPNEKAFKADLKELSALVEAEGRSMDDIEITSMWIYAAQGMDAIAKAEDMGVSRLVIPTQALGPGNPLENLDKLGEALAKR